MNIAAVITASVFVLISVAILIYLFVGKGPLSTGTVKNFMRASCGVYISGTLMVLVFTLILKGLPTAFAVISDITITVVFCFTTGLIYFATKSIVQAAEKAKANAGTLNESSDDGKKDN